MEDQIEEYKNEIFDKEQTLNIINDKFVKLSESIVYGDNNQAILFRPRSSTAIQTDDDPSFIERILDTREKHRSKFYAQSKNKKGKFINITKISILVEKFERLKKEKTYHETPFAQSEIAKIIKKQSVTYKTKSETAYTLK